MKDAVGPKSDQPYSTKAAVSENKHPNGSFKGAGANVVETKQSNGGPDRKGKR